jgi:hypothetical protein
MKRQIQLTWLGFALVAVAFGVAFAAQAAVAANSAAVAANSAAVAANSAAAKAVEPQVPAKEVELFAGMKSGDLDVQIIARNDHAGRVIIANKTGQPVNIELPEAFAAVPVAAQFGGGGGGGGGGFGGGGGGGGGGQQSGGGGFGGGGQGGGGGGGVFSIPPEETAKINVELVCLDHGLRDPSSSKPYKLVPAAEHIDKPAVIELLKAVGRGELEHGAAQAAAWNLNSDMPWNALAAKQTGTIRNIHRSPYFSADQIRAGMAYAQEATRRAEEAEQAKAAKGAEEDEATKPVDDSSSEERSTTDYTAE